MPAPQRDNAPPIEAQPQVLPVAMPAPQRDNAPPIAAQPQLPPVAMPAPQQDNAPPIEAQPQLPPVAMPAPQQDNAPPPHDVAPPPPAAAPANSNPGGPSRIDKLGYLADIGGQVNTLTDYGMGLSNYGNFQGAFGPKQEMTGAQHFSPSGPNAVTNNSAWANPITGGVAALTSTVGGGIALHAAYKGVKGAVGDIREGIRTKDKTRVLEGAGSGVESLASATSAGFGIANSINNLSGGIGGAASSSANLFTVGGQAIPVLGAVTGGIGVVKNTYQLGRAEQRRRALNAIAEAEADPNSDVAKVAAYASQTNAKRRNRAAVNLTSNALATAGGITSASGVGVGVGAALAASGAAVKYGAMGVRAGKQAAREKSAQGRATKTFAENKIAAATAEERERKLAAKRGESYADWEARQRTKGLRGRLLIAAQPNWDKTAAKKNAERHGMAERLLAMPAASRTPVLEKLGCNKQEIALAGSADAADRAKALDMIKGHFARRE
jgi:hypothetical protein